MKLTRCKRVPLHFYDGAKHESCPFCKAAEQPQAEQNTPSQQAAPQSIPPQQAAPQNIPPQQAAPQNIPLQQAAPQNIPPQQAAPQNIPPQQAAPQNIPPQQAAPQNIPPQQAAPQSIPPQQAAPQNIPPQQAAPQNIPPQQAAPQNIPPQPSGEIPPQYPQSARDMGELTVHLEPSRDFPPVQNRPDDSIAPQELPREISQKQEQPRGFAPQSHPDTAPISSFAQQIAESSTTVGMTDNNKTVAMYGDLESDPVAGWLVCVKGKNKGECFVVGACQNTIGRSLTNSICLADEQSVSRECHAMIAFDIMTNRFFLSPGMSSGLTYMNGTLVMHETEIHDYDKVQLGKTVLVFRSLCGDAFSWDDYVG